MVRWISAVVAVFVSAGPLTGAASRAQDANAATPAEADLAPNPVPGAGLGDILVVNMARILTEASAYTDIQAETERVRGLVDGVYEERLARLQAEVDILRDQEPEMDEASFDTQRRALESQAEALQSKRQENITTLEAGRRQAVAFVDQQLNAVFGQIIEEAGARYIFNMQVLVVWPEASDVTARAVELLNEALPTVSFQTTIDGLDEGLLGSD